jgi:hypothetical protein
MNVIEKTKVKVDTLISVLAERKSEIDKQIKELLYFQEQIQSWEKIEKSNKYN